MRTIEYEGKDYELKMTRAGIRAAESQGMTVSEMGEKPFSAIQMLFFAALYSGYKVAPAKAANMLDDLLDSGEVEFSELFEEFVEAYSELFGSGGSE